MDKIKKKIKKIIGNINRIGVKNRDFTIISNNCWGGFVYQKFNLKYRTPFVGLFIFAPDYIELLENFDVLINEKMQFIDANDSKYKEELIQNNTFNKYPIGILGEKVEIHFLHYHSQEEAFSKWNERCLRINRNNLLVKFSDKDKCYDELIFRFDKLKFKNKICFSAKEFKTCSSVITLNEFKNEEFVKDEWKYYKNYINIRKLLNSLNK